MKQPDQREAEAAAADPWMTPERISLRNLAMSFTQKEIVPHLQFWEDAGELPRELHRRAAAAGLLGIGFAEEIGGSGGDLRDLVLLTEAVMEAGGSSGLLASLLTHHIAVPHMAAQGDPEQIRSFVAPTLAGEKIGSLGITEPDTGSDVAGIRTTARRDGPLRGQWCEALHHLGCPRRFRDHRRAYRRPGPIGDFSARGGAWRHGFLGLAGTDEDGLAVLRHCRTRIHRRARAGG